MPVVWVEPGDNRLDGSPFGAEPEHRRTPCADVPPRAELERWEIRQPYHWELLEGGDESSAVEVTACRLEPLDQQSHHRVGCFARFLSQPGPGK